MLPLPVRAMAAPSAVRAGGLNPRDRDFLSLGEYRLLIALLPLDLDCFLRNQPFGYQAVPFSGEPHPGLPPDPASR